MKKKALRKLSLSTETLRHLSGPAARGIAGGGFDIARNGSNPDDDTCYWGCSFTCPEPTIDTIVTRN